MIAMVDDEGYKRMILKNIADHRCDVVKALSLPEVQTISHMATRLANTACKAGIFVQNGVMEALVGYHLRISNFKVSKPVKVVEYASTQQPSQESAFTWWVEETIKQ